jgi:protein SCO1/2
MNTEPNPKASKRQFTQLMLILVAPLIFFSFLFMFGKNRYTLPAYYPLDSVKVDGKWKVTRYHTLPDFTLVNQYGEKFTRQSIKKDEVYVVDFFFTRCGNPTLCPQMSKELSRVQEMFSKNDKVKILSHTVDPEYDTPQVLAKYAQKYGAKRGTWHFLTGLKQDIYSLAFHAYKINALQDSETVTPEFSHATKFILIDGKGRVRGYYDALEAKEVDRMIVEANVVLYEQNLEKELK